MRTMRLFLELFGVIFIALPIVVGTNKGAEVQLNFWRENLPNIQVPYTLAASMSPLTEEEMNRFTKIIKDGNLRSYATEFCNSVNLLCDQSIHVLRRQITNYGSPLDNESDEMNDIFFAAEQLRDGGQITLPDLVYCPWKAFLPRNLSHLIPFSTVALSDVLSSFGISDTSNMSSNMEMTLNKCEAKPEEGEIKACTTSIESMVEFVFSNMGSSDGLDLAFHPAPTADSGKKAKVSRVIERVSVTSNRPPLACHRFPYPYGVFYCHSINGTLAFSMELEVIENNGNHYNATAVCHPNRQSKGSFYCHFIFGDDNMLWLYKDK